MTKFLSLLLTCLVVVPWANEAHASLTFPQVLQEELDMTCAPSCTLCHRDAAGGLGTVREADGGTAFGEALLRAGLRAGDDSSLRAALAQLEAEQTDSDDDGAADVDELSASQSPIRAGSESVCFVTYGCAARMDGLSCPPSTRAVLLALALLVGLLVSRRRREHSLLAARRRPRRRGNAEPRFLTCP